MDAAPPTNPPEQFAGPALGGVRLTGPPISAELSPVTFRSPEKSIPRTVSAAWRSRHLIPPMGVKMIMKIYQRTYLGRAWVFTRPALDCVAGTILFGSVLSVSSGDGTPYVLFITAGLAAWRMFERSVLWSTRSFDRFGGLTGKADMPLLLVPIAGCSPGVVDGAVYLMIVVLIALGYLVIDGQWWLEVGPQTLAAVGGLVLCMVFALAISLWTSVINAHTRDIKHMIRYVLQIGMFLTPVIYPLSKLPDWLRPIAQANPLSAPIDLVKYGLLDSGDVQLVPVLWSCLSIFTALVVGLWFFSRRASNFMGPAGWVQDDEDDV